MNGILRIAFKLLVNEKGKFTALLVGFTFAVFLMVMMTSMFAGILSRASSTDTNIGAKMWVLDSAVNNVSSSIPMTGYVKDAVRSIDGVKYAIPLYSGGARVKLKNGLYQAVTVIGLDDASLFDRSELVRGKIEDIYAENGFIVVQDAEIGKLGNPKISTEFEINDHRGVVVGIVKANVSGLFGIPTLYTTFNRAISYLPSTRFTASYILVEPKSRNDIPHIKQEVKKLGYQALTEDEFIWKISNFYKFQTGLGINVMLMTLISFVVGLPISGQTFYTFVSKQANAGTVPYAEVLGLQNQLSAFEASLPGLSQKLDQSEHLLANLAGHAPSEWKPPEFSIDAFTLPDKLPLSLPSNLVRQRPDILAAEAGLHAASASIGVASAAQFPSFTLSASFGQNSTSMNNLLGKNGSFWNVGPDIATPLFNGGTLAARKQGAIDAYRQSQSLYRQTVISALSQVADTLKALEHDAEALQAQFLGLQAAKDALHLAKINYQAGLVNYLQVLNSEIQYCQARIGYLEACAQRLQDTTAFFVALGGKPESEPVAR